MVIQGCLWKAELLTLIGKKDLLLFYSYFHITHITQLKVEVIFQFTYTQHCL